jgi:cyanate lyase
MRKSASSVSEETSRISVPARKRSAIGSQARRNGALSSGKTNMDRTAALEAIRAARVAQAVTYEDLGKAIGTKDPTYIAAALYGQHRLSVEEAKKLATAVGVDVETAMATTAMPLRTEFPLTTDPFKYRLLELVGVYGDALRERCNELFGDGILSAIDCTVKLEKKGERGVLTIDAKFLHYKEY